MNASSQSLRCARHGSRIRSAQPRKPAESSVAWRHSCDTSPVPSAAVRFITAWNWGWLRWNRCGWIVGGPTGCRGARRHTLRIFLRSDAMGRFRSMRLESFLLQAARRTRPALRSASAFSCDASSRSDSTIMSTSCSKLVWGIQPSFVRALALDPSSSSTSAGR